MARGNRSGPSKIDRPIVCLFMSLYLYIYWKQSLTSHAIMTSYPLEGFFHKTWRAPQLVDRNSLTVSEIMDLHNQRPLQWRHNERDSVSNHQPHHCLFNCLFRRRSKKTLKLRVTGLCVWNSPGTSEFPAQMASYAENVSIWWRHRVISDTNNTPGWRLLFHYRKRDAVKT